jgi:single-stranded DNA-binding protein
MTSLECALFGTLIKDADVRTGKSGKLFALLNLVVGDGDARQFISCIVFGESAGKVGKLEKGRRVCLEGKIEISEWTDRDGKSRAGLKVASFHGTEVSKIRRRRERKPADDGPGAAAPAKRNDFHDDEIPF